MTDVTVGERGAIYKAAGFLRVETAKGGRRALVRYASLGSQTVRHQLCHQARPPWLQDRDRVTKITLVCLPLTLFDCSARCTTVTL
jgi:hypothetical protein